MKLDEPFLETLHRGFATLCPVETLRIAGVELFFGPNPYSIRPAIVCHLVAAGTFPLPVSSIQALAALLMSDGQAPIEFEDPPNLSGIDTLVRWAARLAAALMQQWMGLEFDGGASKPSGAGDTISVWIALHDTATAISSLRLALSVLAMLLGESPHAASGLRSALTALRQLCAQRRPSPETQVMIAAARAIDLPVMPASASPSMWQFGWGVRSELFWVTSSNGDGLVGARISRFKDYQKKLFEELGLPTPRWRLLSPQTDPARALRHVGFPCVVKPTNQSSGRGVTANITGMEMLNAAITMARALYPFIILEAHEPGHDHRLLIVNGRLEMAMRLDPPVVSGDGRRTVSELVADLNRQRMGDKTPGAPSQVPVDEALTLALMSQQLSAESVPEAGQEILLRTNANRATGGTAANVLNEVHPSIGRYAELLAEAAGFRTVGIDYVTPDISRSHEDVGGGFLEINATPGMARVIAAGLVPPELTRLVIGPRPGRIPVSLLIAPTPRLEEVGRKLTANLGETAAIAASNWARLGSVILPGGTMRPIDRVTALLRYRSVTSLQILWAPEDLCQWGLPVDSPDCVALLDASLDPQWSGVVAERAGEVLTPRTVAEAVRLLNQRAKAEATLAGNGG